MADLAMAGMTAAAFVLLVALANRLTRPDSTAPAAPAGDASTDRAQTDRAPCLASAVHPRTADAATAVTDVDSGRAIHLTPTEWKVLGILLDALGRLVTREQVFTALWGANPVADTGYVRLYMSQLRKKLEPDPHHPQYLLTEPGMGYRLVLDSSGSAAPSGDAAEG